MVSNRSIIYDFDRCNGNISNQLILDSLNGYYGCSFSPDGSKFYSSDFSNLYQFNLNVPIPSQSKTLIWNNPYYPNGNVDSTYLIYQHELGPDGKIYISTGYYSWPDPSHFSFQDMNLSIINKPDSLGVLCDFQPWSLYLGGHRTTAGLPNMPNYNLEKLGGSPCDTLNSINEVIESKKSIIRIYPNPVSDELTVEVLNGIAPKQIEINDALGMQILKFTPKRSNTQLNIHSFAKGIYFVKIKMGNGSIEVRKIIKE